MRSILHSLAFVLLSSTAAVAEPTARFVVGLSDVDMAGTAYEDGQLRAPLDTLDTLSVFDPTRPANAIGSIQVSNAVNSPPFVMDVSSDGTRAVVVETLLPRAPGDTTLAQLEEHPGTTLRLVDLTDPANPTLINEVTVPEQPQAAQFNAAGDLVAVAGFAVANGLTVVPVTDEGLGTPATFDLELAERTDIPLDPAGNVIFHPMADIVAVPLNVRNQVVFRRILRDADGAPTAIEPWGNLISTNKWPFVGAFTPDGSHYITSDLMWGPDVRRFYGIVGQGTLTTIALADPAAAEPRHEIVGVQTGGFQSESIAVSPDGTKVAVSSLRATGLPQDSELFDPEASVSLYSFDAESGGLMLIEEERFEAHLPQGLAFDPSGEHLYVGVNEYFDATEPVNRGAIEVWDVGDDGLTRTDVRMPAPRGVHVVQTIE